MRLYKCSTLEKFNVLCGKANGIRHRTIHNLGGDLWSFIERYEGAQSFAHPELCSTIILWGNAKARELGETVNLVAYA